MIFVIKKPSVNQNYYIEMFTTLILRCIKKKTKDLQKHFTTFKYLYFIFQIVTNLGRIQVFASSVIKHDYNNLTFEIHANKN
jgi:hypothetical protein